MIYEPLDTLYFDRLSTGPSATLRPAQYKSRDLNTLRFGNPRYYDLQYQKEGINLYPRQCENTM